MNFQQILLVLKREYTTRIRSKAFIIATILIPLGMVAFMGIGIGIAVWDSQPVHTIGIIDQTHRIYPQLKNLAPDRYKDYSSLPEDSLRSMVQNEKIDGYIALNDSILNEKASPEFVSSGAGGLSLQTTIQSDLREAIRKVRLDQAHVSKNVQDIYESKIELKIRKLSKEGKETEDDTGFLTAVGVIMGVIIFMSVLGYGGLITRSVIEEKTNRIIEVIASSVKPIELLLGKMAGVGALALTQIAIWIISIMGLATLAGPIISSYIAEKVPDQTAQAAAAQSSQGINPSAFTIPTIEPSLIILFVIFFILGYLIYSSLFAAVGAAVDSETDTQQFMFPIMLPIMIGYFIMFRAMANPDSTLAVVGSLIPFCAPIVMITRVAITDVPIWEILTSILLMIGTFVGTMWLSAKIYSVGILSYGKSANFKELLKWVRE